MGRRNLLIAGNSTMPRSVGIWNLPALETCTPSDWCRENCYALQNRYTWRCVQEAYKWRYEMSLRRSFAQDMIDEIHRRRSLEWIRVHISGDFYSTTYVDKWAEVAGEFPNIIFRTNTKRQDLLSQMVKVFPKNFVVRESVDVTRNATGLVPTASIAGTPVTGTFIVCCNNCEKCKFYCWTHSNQNVQMETIL